MEVLVLLDDCHATADAPTSRLYTGFVRECRCEGPEHLDAVWQEADLEMRAGRHAVVLADYEWGVRLLGAGDPDLPLGEAGALRFLIFSSLRHLSGAAVDTWLAAREREDAAAIQGGLAERDGVGTGATELGPAPGPAGLYDLRPSVGPAEFHDAIARILEAINAGETYQVNYSYRLDFRVFGSPISLYRRLRARQPVPFGALMVLPPAVMGGEPTVVLSCSPELFLHHCQGRLRARPMKGTAARAGEGGDDDGIALSLAANPKTLAENLMIVDLLRNDLGRVVRTGSVRVPALFAVEPHGALLQMTSTVEGELPLAVSFPDVLRATFPCGSVTGAPKHHTMRWIGRLESRPRGLYTGAIGWIDPPAGPRAAAACGDFCLSVAIRTLTLQAAGSGHSPRAPRTGCMGVGAGIVSDSLADAEYEECRLKARFLTGLDPGFSLVETLYGSRAAGIRHRERHLQRLIRSAECLGFRLPLQEIQRALEAQVSQLADGAPFRLRLLLPKDGGFELSATRLDELPQGPVSLLLAREPMDGEDPLLGHKTTYRPRYDKAIAEARSHGAFDTLFFNRAGLLTEGGRSNVFLRLDGTWVTPPLTAGVLPGVMRALVLDDPAWGACERPVLVADLERAEGMVVCNALRGIRAARLMSRPGSGRQCHGNPRTMRMDAKRHKG